ncbi:MAG: hypothetical protein HKM06_09510 [Spirochaetales bacterium]|nr:hypothetical protein [Spirochaetales bacterium]
MPSIDVIERFKNQIQALSRENEIRAAQGLPPEEITPPEPLGEDLSELLGGMPLSELPENPEEELPEPQPLSDEAPEAPNELAELFDDPLSNLDLGPDLDQLLDQGLPETPVPAPNDDDLALSNLDALLAEDAEVSDFAPSESEASSESAKPVSTSSVTEDFDTSFFDDSESPADEIEGDYAFEDANTDFAELAGFAETKEEDVEAFDALGEADEFQLGDFESQFGITADDHADSDLLNPALLVEQEIAAAQKTLSLSEEEFSALQRTLAAQPLNLKLAIEELIGEKDVIFDDLNKVIRLLISGASTRVLATTAGKILGRKISVPVSYEKGSGEELEARSSSLWFTIRKVTGPIFKLFLAATLAAGLLVILGWNFLWRPFKAQELYDQGLAQIKLDNGRTADELFAQAYYYWPANDRFYQYAQAYENIGDYPRAQRKFLELLRPSIQPASDKDRAEMDKEFHVFLTPMPKGLDAAGLSKQLDERKAAARLFYNLVLNLLAVDPTLPSTYPTGIQGRLVFLNPERRGILEYSDFETWYGDDGVDPDAHFRRADNILNLLFKVNPYDKEALLREGDNDMEWAKRTSLRVHYDQADRAYSLYKQAYGEDYLILWRFVELFTQTDKTSELLRFKERILHDPNAQVDPEGAAVLSRWLLDQNAAQTRRRNKVVPHQRTLEEEYRMISYDGTLRGGWPAEKSRLEETGEPQGRAFQQEADAAKKPVNLPPPHPYALTADVRPVNYISGLDKIIFRALKVRQNLPELHYELSRYYRLVLNSAEEKKALGAADAYFTELEPRQRRKYGRWGIQVDTLNRIGEIFVKMNQPIQAEAYFLDAKKRYQEGLSQKLLEPDRRYAAIYDNLANLYYAQAPGSSKSPTAELKGGWDQAAELYEKARQMGWNQPELTYRLGVIRYEQKNYVAAVQEFLKLEQSPAWAENWNLLYALGNTLFRTGNYVLADGYYRELLNKLDEKRHTIRDLDVRTRKAQRYLIQRIVATQNNLAAAIDRGSNGLRLSSRSFRDSVRYLSEAQASEVTLGLDLYEDHSELDITTMDDQALQKLRSQEAAVVQKTRREHGLIEANLQILSMAQSLDPSQQRSLHQALEIFPRLPLDLTQEEAP